MNVISESEEALALLDWTNVDLTVSRLRDARAGNALVFCVGNGGGAAHAMHFAADLRKIAKVRALSFDSVPEMTARINDDGWTNAWGDWMDTLGYRAETRDVVFLFSVGGGLDGLSRNLPAAKYGIVGQKGACGTRIVVPSTSTPVIEGCQSVIAHHIVEALR